MSSKKHHEHHRGGDWGAVTDALNALGDSISHVTTAGVDDDENRRRMRELSEGLSNLAARLVSAAEPPQTAAVVTAPSTDATAPAVGQPAPIGTHGAPSEAHWDLPPSMLEAFLAANEKFRAAEGKHRIPVSAAAVEAAAAVAPPAASEPVTSSVGAATPESVPAEQPHPASVTGAFKAVIAEKMSSLIGGVATRVGAHTGAEEEPAEPESSIQDWLYPEGLPESEIQVDSELEPAAGMAEPAAEPENERAEAIIEAPAPTPVEPEAKPGTAQTADAAAKSDVSEPAELTEAAPPTATEPTEPPTTAAAEMTAPAIATEPNEPSEPTTPVMPGTLDPIEVLRIAHERFRAERRSAEESASKAREFAAAHKKGKPAPQPAPPSDDNAPLW